jgi:hypothetical protein
MSAAALSAAHPGKPAARAPDFVLAGSASARRAKPGLCRQLRCRGAGGLAPAAQRPDRAVSTTGKMD